MSELDFHLAQSMGFTFDELEIVFELSVLVQNSCFQFLNFFVKSNHLLLVLSLLPGLVNIKNFVEFARNVRLYVAHPRRKSIDVFVGVVHLLCDSG